MQYSKMLAKLALAPLALLSACGGDDGGIASTPAPAPSPSPSPSPTTDDTSVQLVRTPATQELVVATRGDPIRIRYDASRHVYELKAGNADWSEVIDNSEISGNPNYYFRIAGQPDSSYLRLEAHNRETYPARRYQYSNLAYWQVSRADGGDFGNIAAIGTATPVSGVPVSGTASFKGYAVGEADVKDTGWGFSTTRVGGDVNLNFDFAAGSLAGSIALQTACDCSAAISTGTIAFKNTIYSSGSPTFSGSFSTNAPGYNAFEGQFTGPRAEELIGNWSLPFMFDGASHHASGAWIAKRGD